MNRRVVHVSLLLLVVAAAAVVSTWPLADRTWSNVPVHQDPLFSTWRLYQWARNLAGTGPGGLADGSIFYPAKDVLFFSDAILLPALAAAPLVWLGVPALQAYDVLFWASFLTAGLGMYLFTRDLTGSRAGALVSAAIYTGAPYRIEHIMHLELLWTCWIPLAFWAARRLLAGESRSGRWLAVALVAQFLCCVYYGLFLLTILPVIAGVAWAMRPHVIARPVLLRLGAALLVTVAAVFIYSLPYQRVRATVGDREAHEIRDYSATLSAYVAAPQGNRLWGWTANRLGEPEKRSFVGLTAYLLVVPALLPPFQPWTVGLIAGTVFSVDASLGVNGFVYPLLYRYASPYGGLRVPARFGAIVLACVAALAAIGMARVERALGRPSLVVLATTVVIAVLLVEYQSVNQLRSLPKRPPLLYAWLGRQSPTIIAHLPMPSADRLPGPEADFLYFGQYHRHQMLNGNSGYYPPSYILTLDRVSKFPDERALRELRANGVTLVILHAQHYNHGQYEEKVLQAQDTPGLRDLGEYYDERERTRVFRVLPEN